MVHFNEVQAAVVFGSIVMLLLVGLVVSLASGVVDLTSRRGISLVVCNFSRVLLRVLAYAAGFLAVQRIVGFPLELSW
jgi:hypothetical protein